MTITNIPYTYECRVCDDEGSETVGITSLPDDKTAQLKAIKGYFDRLELKCKKGHPVKPVWAVPDQL